MGTAFVDLVSASRHDARVEALGDRVARVIGALLERERLADRVSPEVTAADVELALFMLAGALSRSDPEDRPGVARRARALFSAAFRPHAQGPA